jgi:hypothetical protein
LFARDWFAVSHVTFPLRLTFRVWNDENGVAVGNEHPLAGTFWAWRHDVEPCHVYGFLRPVHLV